MRFSFVQRLLLLVSALLIVIFGATGYWLRSSISKSTNATLESEIMASFRAYEALWRANSQTLEKLSSVISRMADVRAAFQTRDRATIQDTAGELWSRVGAGNAIFTVADGNGKVIANLGSRSPFTDAERLNFIAETSTHFPAQTTGFLRQRQRLFQVVVTPVYVDSSNGKALLNVLVTGFELDHAFLESLRGALGGSDLIFEVGNTASASTVTNFGLEQELGAACKGPGDGRTPRQVKVAGTGYMVLRQALPVLSGSNQGELCIVRSLGAYQRSLSDLLTRTLLLWVAGLLAAVVCTYLLVRRLMQPVALLDKAASEIAQGNYQVRVDAQRDDELGRLAKSFNAMSGSLEQARAELIRHERLESVARLATMVVHDLRNPLASIYAGAEMLVDGSLPEKQVRRLANNMYRASRGVMKILGGLLSAARRQSEEREPCLISDVVIAAWNDLEDARQHSEVELQNEMPADLELLLDRGPMERVFHNLFENAMEAINGRGTIRTWAERNGTADVLLHVRDTGPGVTSDLRATLFQPFASKGRAGGMGLGLALSRQTLQAHGGDLWCEFTPATGGHFVMRVPLAHGTASAGGEP